MSTSSHGIFSVDELNIIRDAHVEWCAEQSIDPASPAGQDAVKLMIEAYREGKKDRDQLVAVCNLFVEERKSHVRLGSPAIDSVTDKNAGE